MRRYRLILALFAAVILIVGVVLVLAYPRQPVYKGVTLRQWIDQHAFEEKSPYVEAMNHFGSNAVPWLIRWMQDEPSNSPQFAVRVLGRVVERFRFDWEPSKKRSERAWRSGQALRHLGPRAQCAYPDLCRMATNTQAAVAQERAIQCLPSLGSNGVTFVYSILTNTQSRAVAREEAVTALGTAGTNALFAVPALIQCAQGNEQHVATKAMWALGHLRLQPEIVVPALLPAAQRPNNIQIHAIWVLGCFGRKASNAIPVLQQIAADTTDPKIQNAARTALAHIAPGPPGH